ncbi:hypothetical protein BU17DRAFT_96840 [Hysterangium stoloniferum]|nr:hypothetical protein BU17DRAFT_96840 [Hysterangium stoloniferum]
MPQKSKAAQSHIKNLGSKAQKKPSVTIKDVPDDDDFNCKPVSLNLDQSNKKMYEEAFIVDEEASVTRIAWASATGAAWAPATICGAAWASITIYGAAWASITIYGAAWVFVAVNGAGLASITIFSMAWDPVSMYGTAWAFVTIYSTAWASTTVYVLLVLLLPSTAWIEFPLLSTVLLRLPLLVLLGSRYCLQYCLAVVTVYGAAWVPTNVYGAAWTPAAGASQARISIHTTAWASDTDTAAWTFATIYGTA